jgi:hypothetical protein
MLKVRKSVKTRKTPWSTLWQDGVRELRVSISPLSIIFFPSLITGDVPSKNPVPRLL